MSTDHILMLAKEASLLDSRDEVESIPADYKESILYFAELVRNYEKMKLRDVVNEACEKWYDFAVWEVRACAKSIANEVHDKCLGA